MEKKKSGSIILFAYYSWIAGIGWKLLDIMPFFTRHFFLRLFLASLGKGSFVDYTSYFRYMRQIRIGKKTTINRGVKILASHFHKDVYVSIGSNCAIAPEVIFLAAAHDYSELSLPDTAKSITVGDYVWIGARSAILPGITIGEGAVIGAGSVVSKDVAPYTVVAGVPARFIKNRELKK